jgi:predicted nucleic acid-binding protein
MSTLLDTNVLLRVVNKNDPLRPVALSAIRVLPKRNEPLYYTPQVLAEFAHDLRQHEAALVSLQQKQNGESGSSNTTSTCYQTTLRRFVNGGA